MRKGAGSLDQLNRRRPDSRTSRVNQDMFANRQSALREQGVVRSHKNLRHDGRFGPIEIVRNARQMILWNCNVLRLSAAADDSQDTVANFPFADFVSY